MLTRLRVIRGQAAQQLAQQAASSGSANVNAGKDANANNGKQQAQGHGKAARLARLARRFTTVAA